MKVAGRGSSLLEVGVKVAATIMAWSGKILFTNQSSLRTSCFCTLPSFVQPDQPVPSILCAR